MHVQTHTHTDTHTDTHTQTHTHTDTHTHRHTHIYTDTHTHRHTHRHTHTHTHTHTQQARALFFKCVRLCHSSEFSSNFSSTQGKNPKSSFWTVRPTSTSTTSLINLPPPIFYCSNTTSKTIALPSTPDTGIALVFCELIILFSLYPKSFALANPWAWNALSPVLCSNVLGRHSQVILHKITLSPPPLSIPLTLFFTILVNP